MNVRQINECLAAGAVSRTGVFPHLDGLASAPFVFTMRFGLEELPEDPGVILVRGARQSGKSTWLEGQIKATIERHGPGSAFYLNGDELRNAQALSQSVQELTGAFRARAPVRRLFIDEITAIAQWQKGLKRLIDSGELRGVLVVTTGSKATDLRRGAERLPGRKGRLDRTSYLFTPLSYAEFKRVCGSRLGKDTVTAYLLSGGSPVACGELAARGRLPEYVTEMVRDWVYGETAASGRSRPSLLAVLEVLLRRGGVPLGQAKLAREAGLSNNTVAVGYVDLLADLMCVSLCYAWDHARRVRLAHKPCKYHFTNLLAAVAWDAANLRCIEDFKSLAPETRGHWWEWLVAQELWRRAAIRGDEMPEIMAFWQSKEHELDFVSPTGDFIEVKSGAASPLDFAWFPRTFPGKRLTVINARRFETDLIRGITMEDFLLEETSLGGTK